MKTFSGPILVTRPYLPSLDEFQNGVKEIWNNQYLTNNGPLLQRFHKGLSSYLNIDTHRIDLFNNGTLALEIGLYSWGLSGSEIITTPFTFVATAHAIRRIGAIPVFADVDPENLCLDPVSCEKKITPRTKAIVPVHVYGHPCDVKGFQRLADKYGVKIIYDAAHAFGVKYGGKSIAEYGDMAMFSFHPTKLFHSCEGGLLAFSDPSLQAKVERLRNFAILSETVCDDVGTNAKMNELQALMGECCLRHIDELIEHRKQIHQTYEEEFQGCKNIRMVMPCSSKSSSNDLVLERNDAYCPILLKDFETRERVYAELKKRNVFSRRYFYPLLTDFVPYRGFGQDAMIARDAAARVLTLPTYHNLSTEIAVEISRMIKELAE